MGDYAGDTYQSFMTLPCHRIREAELDARVQQHAEAVRNQWIAEQTDLQRLYRKWSLKRKRSIITQG